MSMKIFVAGGTGVLGQASLRPLVEAGHTVRSTARGKEKAELVRRMGAEPIEIDLYDPKAVRQAIAGSDALIRLTTKIGSLTKLASPRARIQEWFCRRFNLETAACLRPFLFVYSVYNRIYCIQRNPFQK